MSLPATAPPLPPALAVADHGYSQATVRLLASNWRWWTSFCAGVGELAIPPFSSELIKSAVIHRIKEQRTRATIDALLNTLSAASKAAGHPCPTHGQEFREWYRAIRRRSLPARQRQARGMTYTDLEAILGTIDQNTATGARDGALLCAAFDGLLRSNEVSALTWEDLSISSDGSATALLRRSKTDQLGQGKKIYFSARTVEWLAAWGTFGERRGAIFRPVKGEPSGDGMTTRSIRRIFKRRGLGAGIAGLSGHSARVGAAQDATAANVPLQALMVAGRWTGARMPARYAEETTVSLLGKERTAAIARLHERRKTSEPQR